MPARPAQSPPAPTGPGDSDDPALALAGVLLFEVAWEVCNQVGGIYQVVRSKVPAMNARWHGRYCLIGPYVEAKATLEFEAAPAPRWLERVIAELAEEGLPVHHGRWLVPGSPRVLLVDHAAGAGRLGGVKYELWNDHHIESPGQDWWVDGAITFADAVRRLLEKIARAWTTPEREPALAAAPASAAKAGGGKPAKANSLTTAQAGDTSPRPNRRMIAHFHEWLGGLALPMIRRARLPIATVFTTHATLLGRYIASADERFYEHLHTLNGDEQARKFNVRTQHAMEKACAHSAHVFTTVSSITAEECSQLLGRTPDHLLPNGLHIDRFYAAHHTQNYHAEYKERINLFVMGHFFPSYSFDLEKTLYFFTSGRFEPRNKGFDLCLESMARLNAELKALRSRTGSAPTVVFFIITQRSTQSLNPAVLEKRGVLNELREVCRRISDGLGEKLFRGGAAGAKMHLDDLVDEYWRLRYRRVQFALRTNRLPLSVTHILDDESRDPVLSYVRQLGLVNKPDDPVKVVYHPEFINPVSPLWGIEYEQFVRGCHLGIFPSLYEPWGYTPLECLALGVPAVTSDLAGFGRYAAEEFYGHEERGLHLIHRRGRSYADAAAELTQKLTNFCILRRRDRIALRNAVERFAWEFDWSRLGQAYHRAHDLALLRREAEVRAAQE